MLKHKTIFSLTVAASMLFACSDDDGLQDDGGDGQVVTPELDVPDTYNFERDGSSTVSYDGQTTRIRMGNELDDQLTDNSNSEMDLLNMYAHQEGNDDFSEAALNASGKSLRSKTAASKDYFSANSTDANAIKNQIDGWLSGQATEVFPNWTQVAEQGQAGQLQQAGGGSVRYLSASGLEYNQAVLKSLIGALYADQLINNYLSPAVLDEASNVEDNNNDVTEAGESYTTMEHKWDEAFGYLYGNDDAENPQYQADSFLNKYIIQVDEDPDFAGIAQETYDAFKLGRAAIVAKDYDLRDEQAEIIRENISTVIGVRAIYYMQKGKNKLGTDTADAFHQLSEGFGFINSLQFTRKPNSPDPYVSRVEVDGFIEQLMAGEGFWDVEPSTLDAIAQEVASRFDFTVEEAAPDIE